MQAMSCGTGVIGEDLIDGAPSLFCGIERSYSEDIVEH